MYETKKEPNGKKIIHKIKIKLTIKVYKMPINIATIKIIPIKIDMSIL